MMSKPQFVGEKSGTTLKDSCVLIMGQSPSSNSYNTSGDGLPFYQGNADFGEESPVPRSWCTELKKIAEKGDILISVRAPIGAINIADEKCCIGRGVAAIRPNQEVMSPDFLQHQLFASRNKLEAMGTGSTFKAIGKKMLSDFPVVIYPKNTQEAIAQQLNLIKKQIKTVNSQLDQLDSLVKSRFVEMFGDPIENPFDWRTKSLSNLGNLKNGVNFKSVDSGTKIRCLSVSDFKDCYQISNMELISSVSLNNKPNKTQLLRDGDVVFVRSNGNKRLVGRCLAIFPGDEDVTFSGFCIRFHNESNELLLDYLLGCLKSDSMRKAMTGRGANIQNLSQKILSEVVLPIPPLTLQQEFATFVQHVDKSRFISISRYRDILIKRMDADIHTYKALIDRHSPN